MPLPGHQQIQLPLPGHTNATAGSSTTILAPILERYTNLTFVDPNVFKRKWILL